MRAMSRWGIPSPVSVTRSSTRVGSPVTVTSTEPPGCVYRTALSTRLRTSSARSRPDPCTDGTPSACNTRATPVSRASSCNRWISSAATASSRIRSSRSLPVSSRERSSRSDTMRDSRRASRSSCSVKRRAAGGSSIAPARSVSAAARIDETGVFSSWEAFATKSRRTRSRRRASVTSRTTTRTEPSSPTGIAAARSQRAGAPVSASARMTAPVNPARLAARWISSGSIASTESGTAPRCRASASLANTRRPSGSRSSTPSSIEARIVS